MASIPTVVACALLAVLAWGAIGLPLARAVLAPALAWGAAPILGWAVHGALAIPIFLAIPLGRTTVVVVAACTLAAAVAVARFLRPLAPRDEAMVPLRRGDRAALVSALVLATLLAAAVASAVLPKGGGAAVFLADPIFDHAKASLVDELARDGLPPTNPYIAHDGGSGRLAYYYLWHFTAAELALATGATGWEADAALTFFAAFASLAAMMGLARHWSGRALAPLLVVAFAASASARNVLIALFGAPDVDRWLRPPGGFGGWLFQSSWVPQHVASATCVLVAVHLMTTLARDGLPLRIALVALVSAAAFESSTWIGGVVFGLAAIVVAPVVVAGAVERTRLRTVVGLAVAGAAALVLAGPFVRDQLVASTTRQDASPIRLAAFPVLGDAVARAWRPLLDVAAYPVLLLTIEFAAVFVPGLFAIAALRRASQRRRTEIGAFAALVLVALLGGGYLRSTLADNNDLAWRAGLLASMGLVAFAAAGLATWIAERRRVAIALTGLAILSGWPEGARMVAGDLTGYARPGAEAFARHPALWERVRAIARPDERVANNPMSLAQLTPWPVNIGWSLLANRRSCYAAWELDQVYTSIPHASLRRIHDRFTRVFDGEGVADDVDALANRYDCAVVVVTPEDGAWTNDPFAKTADYVLAAEAAGWRIYRRRPR